MKRVLILLSILFCGIAYAATETINWYMDGQTYSTTTCQTGGDIILPTTPNKRGYTFQGWASYIPIEYLESTGTQYIDTGYRFTDTITAKMDISRQNALGAVFGYRFVNSATAYGNMRFFSVHHDGRVILRFGDEVTNSVTKINENQKVELELNTPTNTIYLNGQPIVQAQNKYYTEDFGNIYFFCANTNGYYDADMPKFIGKIYYLKIYDNDVLVRDFIPVLDENGTPCMYDRVEKKFYYNQGTGQFIAGPVLTE